MDHYWRKLRDEVPTLPRPPSEYVREHISFTTQPVAEPNWFDHFRSLLEMIHAEETLMYASDFPTGTATIPRTWRYEGFQTT